MGFVTTRWSVVLAAGRGSSPEARAALETLCGAYWYPLYGFARRSGHDAHDAQDAVQGFLARLLEKDAFAAADPERGRFRSFLLASFRNFLRNEAERAAALKRGGGRVQLSLTPADPDSRFDTREPVHGATPERLFERDWSLAVLEQVLVRLRQRYAARGNEALFDAIKDTLTGHEKPEYLERAAALGMTEGALKVAVHRLRGRYRDALRDEIGQTLAEGEDIDEEIAALFRALGPV